jgi:hypothetical protein
MHWYHDEYLAPCEKSEKLGVFELEHNFDLFHIQSDYSRYNLQLEATYSSFQPPRN